MSAWKPRRFWKIASPAPVDAGWTVRLDDRPVKTPAKALLVVPTEAMAQAIAAEWDAQEREVRPETMPVTRAANSALDKVATQYDEVAAMLAAYAGSDLLCYRATGPEPLVARQSQAWDPLLAWARDALGLFLTVTSGVMPVAQAPDVVPRATALAAGLGPFRLAAFHDLVAISGSFILAMAVIRGQLSVADAWAMSRIDELWQIEEWGEDDEAMALAAARWADFERAARFYDLCG